MSIRWKWVLGIVAFIFLGFVAIVVIVSAYGLNTFKPDIADLVKEYTGRELTLAGDMKLAISLYPTLVAGDVSFQNAPWGSRPDMMSAKRIEIQVGLLPLIRGHIKVERLVVVGADYLIETDKNGTSNMAFDVPKGPAAEPEKKEPEQGMLAVFGFKEIVIKEGKLTMLDHRDDTTHVFIIKECTRDTDAFEAASTIRLVGLYNDKPMEIQGKIGPLGHIFDPSYPWELDVSADVFDTKVTAAGRIQDVLNGKGMDVTMSANGNDLADLHMMTGKLLPLTGPFSVSGHVVTTESGKNEVSDLEIVLGESHVRGSIAMDDSSEKRQITATLASDTLDLRPFMDQEEPAKVETEDNRPDTQKSSGKVFSDKPFELEGLHKVNGHIDLQINQLLLPRLAFENVQAKVVLKDGHFSIDPFKAGAGGGSLDSRLSLVAKGSQLHLDGKVQVTRMDLGDMLKRLDITNDLDGTLDLDIDVRGEGDSVADLMGGFNGDVVAILGAGKMPVTYLNLVGGNLSDNLMQIVNPFSENIDRADINCAVCDFNITDGVAQSDVIVLDDPRKTIVSDGNIDLKTEKLDFGIFTEPKEGLGTKETGKVSISLSAITKPFKLGGTLANPILGIDPERTAKTIGTALLGPAGIAYLLVSTSAGKDSPCAKALEIAGQRHGGDGDVEPEKAKIKKE